MSHSFPALRLNGLDCTTTVVPPPSFSWTHLAMLSNSRWEMRVLDLAGRQQRDCNARAPSVRLRTILLASKNPCPLPVHASTHRR